MNKASAWLVIAGAVVVFGTANYTIWQRQQVVDHGQAMLLDLRPVDPRSLIQGDYMQLRYAEPLFPTVASRASLPGRGTFVVRLDNDNVATFSRLDDGSRLEPNEARLKYKLRDTTGAIRLGAESFFFQEGQADIYSNARYGVLHVDADGNSVLVGLAGDDKAILRPAENK